MSKSKVELVIANATKINASDSLVVLVDPPFADMMQDVFEELVRLTGHDRHTVLPIPADAVKFYQMKQEVQMSIDPAFVNDGGVILDKEGNIK